MPEWILAGVILIGLGAWSIREMVRAEARRIVEDSQKNYVLMDELGGKEVPQKPEYNGSLFDCPECNLPAEVATYVTMWDPDSGRAVTYVVINCLSDHDLITVSEEWFVDNVLSQLND